MKPPSKAATPPPSAGAGWFDNFRLRGSRPCRRMGGHLTRVGWRTQVVHALDDRNSALSEGEALAVVVEKFPRSGVRRAGAPRQPQCITLGRLAPRHLAVRRRRRCPRLARRGGAPCEAGCRWRDGWPRPNCDHAPEPCGRAVHCRGRPFRFPHRRRDLRSLRGKSVQAAFRGVLVCQGA